MKQFIISAILASSAITCSAMDVIRGGFRPSNQQEVMILVGMGTATMERHHEVTCPVTTVATIIEDSIKNAVSNKMNRALPLVAVISREIKTRTSEAVANRTCSLNSGVTKSKLLTVDDLVSMLAGDQNRVLFARGFILAAHDFTVINKCQMESKIGDTETFFQEVGAAILKAQQLNNGRESASKVLEVLFSTMTLTNKCV